MLGLIVGIIGDTYMTTYSMVVYINGTVYFTIGCLVQLDWMGPIDDGYLTANQQIIEINGQLIVFSRQQ